MRLHRPVLGLVVPLVMAVLAGGCGGGDSHHGSSDPKGDAPPGRTIDVTMKDIHYDPTSVEVKAGETVKFVFRNEGSIVHDAFIGDEAAQEEHEKDMRKGDGDDHGDDGHAVTVEPGSTGSLTYTFEKPATLVIGCHQAGHYSAGMRVKVTIA